MYVIYRRGQLHWLSDYEGILQPLQTDDNQLSAFFVYLSKNDAKLQLKSELYKHPRKKDQQGLQIYQKKAVPLRRNKKNTNKEYNILIH